MYDNVTEPMSELICAFFANVPRITTPNIVIVRGVLSDDLAALVEFLLGLKEESGRMCWGG